MPVNDPEQKIEADADELEERIGKLDSHLGEAREKAKARSDSGPAQETAGDWEDTDDDAGGEDPAGFDDPEAEEEDD